jgi:hypothetical protein
MRRAQTDQQMHMIGNAADALSSSPRRANDSTKVCIQITAPGGLDQRRVIFRSKNDVIMQA